MVDDFSAGDPVKNKLYKVETKLGQGGFGQVYKVRHVQTGIHYAMKSEPVAEETRVLKMEVSVLEALGRLPEGPRHACRIVDRGRTSKSNYIIMTLLGQSLVDLESAMPDGRFTKTTILKLSLQAVDAIQELHEAGVIHRDIKPANFAIGRDDPATIYLFDYGLARLFTDENGTIRPPRKAPGFRGTGRYASIVAHEGKDQSRKDDLESLLYQMMEMYLGDVPWVGAPRKVTHKKKLELRKEFPPKSPAAWKRILSHLDSLDFYTIPNYGLVKAEIKSIMKENKIKLEDLFDWEKDGKVENVPNTVYSSQQAPDNTSA